MPDRDTAKKAGRLQGMFPTKIGRELLVDAGRLLKEHFWPIIIIYTAKDSLSFMLHRLSQRLTNAGKRTWSCRGSWTTWEACRHMLRLSLGEEDASLVTYARARSVYKRLMRP